MTEEMNVQNHFLVPKHTLLTKEETEQLLTKYNISSKQMPHISLKDPALRELNAQPGDIIQISRNSETELDAVFFRIVKKE